MALVEKWIRNRFKHSGVIQEVKAQIPGPVQVSEIPQNTTVLIGKKIELTPGQEGYYALDEFCGDGIDLVIGQSLINQDTAKQNLMTLPTIKLPGIKGAENEVFERIPMHIKISKKGQGFEINILESSYITQKDIENARLWGIKIDENYLRKVQQSNDLFFKGPNTVVFIKNDGQQEAPVIYTFKNGNMQIPLISGRYIIVHGEFAENSRRLAEFKVAGRNGRLGIKLVRGADEGSYAHNSTEGVRREFAPVTELPQMQQKNTDQSISSFQDNSDLYSRLTVFAAKLPLPRGVTLDKYLRKNTDQETSESEDDFFIKIQ